MDRQAVRLRKGGISGLCIPAAVREREIGLDIINRRCVCKVDPADKKQRRAVFFIFHRQKPHAGKPQPVWAERCARCKYTDAAVSAPLLKEALAAVAADTFNMMSVDGDTSTNDTLAVMANGAAGNAPVTEKGADYDAFVSALRTLCTALTKALAADGEGATKLLECRVTGGKTTADAKTVAKAVINSALLKAAMFGADANWGRVLCAIGYSGAPVDVHGVDVSFASAAGSIPVCRNGAGIDFSEEKAKEILSEKEIVIDVTLRDGNGAATAWGCDLTYDYVKINGDYRS